MKLLLYPHGGSGNHGCEAIVRSTVKITRSEATLFSTRVEEDFRYGLSDICHLESEISPLRRCSSRFAFAWIRNHIFNDNSAFDKALFHPVISSCASFDYALSIGGDNYCYGAPQYIYMLNHEFRKRKVRTILWGCSVEPDSIYGEMLEDLKGYTKIIARESITYYAMMSRGLSNVCLYPDPAFVLDVKNVSLPFGFVEGNTVGINLSPLIMTKGLSDGIVLDNYVHLIDYIIHQTDLQVALIPHVVWKHNDDRWPLSLLYNSFKNTGRVIMINDHNAEELKGIISKCRFMVAARTHASIAAYSTRVPTLVIGYSVKSKGIAQDIFGTHEHYVLPVQSINNQDVLRNEFCWLIDHESDIKKCYDRIIPEYNDKARQIGDVLANL